jgi:hypothetical protein
MALGASAARSRFAISPMADNQRLCLMQLFIPARNRKEAERDAPRWACRFARVTGGFIAFDSEEALQRWKATTAAERTDETAPQR